MARTRPVRLLTDPAAPVLRVPDTVVVGDDRTAPRFSIGSRRAVSCPLPNAPPAGDALAGIAVVGPSFGMPRADDLVGIERLSAVYGLLNERLLNERRFVTGPDQPVPVLLSPADGRRISAGVDAVRSTPLRRILGTPEQIAASVAAWAESLP